MPPRVPLQAWTRSFSSTCRTRSSIPPQFHTYNPSLTASSATAPKLGRIGRWYLPTMALIAVGMIYLPNSLLSFSTFASSPSRRPVTLDSANRHIGFGIANALEEHNRNRRNDELTQAQRNAMLLDAYGARSSLEDMQRAFDIISKEEPTLAQREKNRRLSEAYGDKTSLKDVQRAMEIYEVQ